MNEARCSNCMYFQQGAKVVARCGDNYGTCEKLRARIAGPGLIVAEALIPGDALRRSTDHLLAVESDFACIEHARLISEDDSDDETLDEEDDDG